jgi:BREX system ATP-binding protein BrxC/D
MTTPGQPIRPRERDTIIQALAAGVVPSVGLRHIQVGRANEVGALVRDLDRIAEGGAAVRFIIGEYGAGKTFFLNLVRIIALEKRLVTVQADFGPDRRLHATGGQARALYAECARNMATRSKAEGGAFPSVVEVFVTKARDDAQKAGRSPDDEIRGKLAGLKELVGGYDFADVVAAYWQASETGNDVRKDAAIRWLRGEFTTKTDARAALGVRTIVDDASIYDHWKLLARFVRLAGYAGLLVVLDELVNLYKLQSAKSREANYEQILRILNDVLQGQVEGLGFALGGTTEFMFDSRRGLFSYPALQSRLAENTFAKGGLVDTSGPVIKLQSLTPEDLFVLLGNIRNVFAGGDPAKYLVPDEALEQFMHHCQKKIGDAYFRTPRTTVKQFIALLSVIVQNPGTDWRAFIGEMEPVRDAPEGPAEIIDKDGDGELATFRL